MKAIHKFKDLYKNSDLYREYERSSKHKNGKASRYADDARQSFNPEIRNDRLNPDLDKAYHPCSLAERPEDAIAEEGFMKWEDK